MKHLGIDPGLSGAVTALDNKGVLLWVEDTPTVKAGKKTIYDAPRMASILSREKGVTVTIEQAQGMPGQGITSTFRIGEGFGLWLGLIAALGIPFFTVRPATWQKAMFRMVATGSTTKEKSVTLAKQIFPEIRLVPEGCRKPKDGRSDAALIARYGWLISTRNTRG